jgi:hypothetical protein
MKRFSAKFFIITLLHMLGNILLFDAGFAELRAMKQSMDTGQPEPSFVWLSVCFWIWQPVPKLMQYYDQHHPRPVVEVEAKEWKADWGNSANFFVMLLWSVFIAFCFGFLDPRLSRRRRAIA